MILAVCGLALGEASPSSAAEPQDVSFRATWDGSEQRYVVVLPGGFDPLVTHDVLVALHGHGSDRWQFVRDGRAECRAAREAAARYGLIYVSPDYRAKTSWMGPAAEADLLQILAELRQRYRIGQVVVSGGSMGGTAALTFAALHPQLVAGVVSMNGTANLVEYDQFQDAIAASYGGTKTERPDEYRKRSAELHADRLTMPLALTTGGRDRLVPPESVQRLAQVLQAAGRDVHLIHQPAGGHDTNLADATAAFDYVCQRVAARRTSQLKWNRVAPPLAGRRWDIPLAAAGDGGTLYILGGRTTWGDYKKPRPYDVLAWNDSQRVWENQFPLGQNWGPPVGDCQAPAWKDERFGFLDVAGNVRPNWTVYGTFSLGQKYAFDRVSGRFYFLAAGSTFSYDPQQRVWTDLQPPTTPEQELGGTLLWSSLCLDAHRRRLILFGGGNVQTERGDPGTWAYSLAENRWSRLPVERQPPPRANSRLVYDPETRRVLLFGGDQLAQLLADTWTFDVTTDRWEEQTPPVSPSPRAGHALVWLPQSRRIALVGGYSYTSTTGYCASLYEPLPCEVWLWDSAAVRWQFVERWRRDEAPQGPTNFFLSAAARTVEGRDRLTVLADGTWEAVTPERWETDERLTQLAGVPPGTTLRRTGSYDPAWYTEDIPAAEPQRVAAELAALPTNRWTVRPTPKLPGMNMDWGSAVFAAETDQIVRFSGGHSAYSGTAPVVYDVATDRYRLPFAPEMPLEYVYSNDQVGGEWSFAGNPWMTGHTYKSTGYDARLGCLVFAPHDFTYFFSPTSGRWTRSDERNPYRADFYNVTLCGTPAGVVAWGDRRSGGAGLWRLDATSRRWQPLPLNGTLPDKSPDQHGLACDTARNRLLFFSAAGAQRGNVVAYALDSGEARPLNPSGKEFAAVPSREAVYLPDADVVLLGARTTRDEHDLWLLYDCRANAWRGIELGGDDPIGKGTSGRSFHNSVGISYDPRRRLVWAVGQYSKVHVLRLDASAALTLAP